MKLFTFNERTPKTQLGTPSQLSSWTSGAAFLSLVVLNHCCQVIGFNIIPLEKDAEDNGWFCLGIT